MDKVITTHEGHQVSCWHQNGVLNAVSEHAEDDVEAVVSTLYRGDVSE